MPAAEINYLAVFVVAILNMVLGALWYAPAVFGNQWMKLSGKKMGENSNASLAYGLTFVASLLMAFVLAHVIDYVGANTWFLGIQTGIWMWLGFVATTLASDMLFAKWSLQLFLINSGYRFVALMMMGAMLASWL